MPAVSVELNHFIAPTAAAETPAGPSSGLLSRIIRAIHDAQIRRAEREVARFIEGRGGRITDALERQIQRHFV